jgi:hypothetical protein
MGIEVIRRARTKRGYYSKTAIRKRRQARAEVREHFWKLSFI